MAIGERESGPASTLRKKAQSLTFRAIGPETERVNHPSDDGLATRPGEGRMPTTLLKFPGLRRDQPMSLPSTIGAIPHASETAPPPVLPPHVLVVSQGLRVGPNTLLKVWDPKPNSGTFVFPITIAPAAFSR